MEWTRHEVEKLREMRGAGRSIEECARALGRTPKSVENKVYALGMVGRRRKPREPLQETFDFVWAVSPDEAEEIRLAAFDSNKFKEFWERHRGLAIFFLRKRRLMVSEENLASAMVALWRAASSYDPSVGKFSTWFGCLLLREINESEGNRGRRKRTRAVSLDSIGEIGLEPGKIDESQDLCNSDDNFRSAVSAVGRGLSYRHAAFMRAHFQDGLSYKAIGETAGVTGQCVKNYVDKAVRHLREKAALGVVSL